MYSVFMDIPGDNLIFASQVYSLNLLREIIVSWVNRLERIPRPPVHNM